MMMMSQEDSHLDQNDADTAAAAAGLIGGDSNACEVKSPIVFQCAGCRQILGDSLSLINADEELRNVTLQGKLRVEYHHCGDCYCMM